MTSVQQITTAEQLLQAGDLGCCELVRGELVMMSPAGFDHGWIGQRLGARLSVFVEGSRLGVVTGSDTGFVLARDPDTVRAPDVAFISAARVPDSPTPGFFEGAPDLAVEVLSPSDRASDLLDKVQEWLAAGCRAVWVVDPQKKTVSIYQSRGPVRLLRTGDRLEGGEVLPGFSVAVDDIFSR
jgi:Uma2 family endonuclease